MNSYFTKMIIRECYDLRQNCSIEPGNDRLSVVGQNELFDEDQCPSIRKQYTHH